MFALVSYYPLSAKLLERDDRATIIHLSVRLFLVP